MAGISRIVMLPLIGLLIIVLAGCSSIVRKGDLIREEIGLKVRDEVSKRADQLADQIEKLEEHLPLPAEESPGQSDDSRVSYAAPSENVETANGASATGPVASGEVQPTKVQPTEVSALPMETDSPLALDTTSVDSHAVRDMGPWMTLLSVVTIALESSPGVPIEVSGHVALAQGEIEVGDPRP